MLEALDAAETERIVRERLATLDAGQPGVAAEQVLAEIRKRLGVERK